MEAETGETFWARVFGRPGAVEIEIGPGCGSFLLHASRANPGTNYLGIEASRSRAAQLEAQLCRLRLPNVIVIHAPAECVIRNLVPPASVAAFHLYFPDPWWKRRHHRRRLFSEPFVHAMTQALIAGGRIFVATDVPLVREAIRHVCSSCPDLRENALLRPVRAVATRFERKARARGATIYDLVFEKVLPQQGRCFPASAQTNSPRETTTALHS